MFTETTVRGPMETSGVTGRPPLLREHKIAVAHTRDAVAGVEQVALLDREANSPVPEIPARGVPRPDAEIQCILALGERQWPETAYVMTVGRTIISRPDGVRCAKADHPVLAAEELELDSVRVPRCAAAGPEMNLHRLPRVE